MSATYTRPPGPAATPAGDENSVPLAPWTVRRWPPSGPNTCTRSFSVSATTIVPLGPTATPPGESRFGRPEPELPNEKRCCAVGPNTCTRSFSVSATTIVPLGPTATPAGSANSPAPVPVVKYSVLPGAAPIWSIRTAPEPMSAAATYPPPVTATPAATIAAPPASLSSLARAPPAAPTSATPPRPSATTALPYASTATPAGAAKAPPPAMVRTCLPPASSTCTRSFPVSATHIVRLGPAATPPGESNCPGPLPGEPILVTVHLPAPSSDSLAANTAPAPPSETSTRPPRSTAIPVGRTNPAAPNGSMSVPSYVPSPSPSDKTSTLPPRSATTYLPLPLPPSPICTAPARSTAALCRTSSHSPPGTPTTPMCPLPCATTTDPPPPCTADTARGAEAPPHAPAAPRSQMAAPRASTRWCTGSATRMRPSGAAVRRDSDSVPVSTVPAARSPPSYTLTLPPPEPSLSSTLPNRSMSMDGRCARSTVALSRANSPWNILILRLPYDSSSTATRPSGPAATSHTVPNEAESPPTACL